MVVFCQTLAEYYESTPATELTCVFGTFWMHYPSRHRQEAADDLLSCTIVEESGLDVRVKFGVRSKHSWDIEPGLFVADNR